MDQSSDEYKKFKDIINIFHELLHSSEFRGYMKQHPGEMNSYNELKSYSSTLKDAGEINEEIAKNFLEELKKLIHKVYPAPNDQKLKEKKTYLDACDEADIKLTNVVNKSGNFQRNMSITKFKKNYYESASSRMKSYATIFILIVIILGIIFISGKLKRDTYPFLIFMFMVCFPLIVTFRREIYKILPIKITSDNELETATKTVTKHQNSQLTKDYTQVFAIIFLNIFTIVMLVTKGKELMGIALAMMSSVTAGVLVLEL